MKVSVPSHNNAPGVNPPRYSWPLSFFSKKVFVLACALMSLPISGNAADCVCNYSSTVDYFPVKLSSDYSPNFKIEYFNSFKKVTVFHKGNSLVTYAYLCGTPMPANATSANAVQIPIDSAAVISTTFLPDVEYIGKRTSLQYVPAAINNLKPCARKMYDRGDIVTYPDNYDVSSKFGAINGNSIRRTGESLDMFFLDDYSFDHLSPAINASFGAHTKTVVVKDTLEKTPFAKLEWVEFFAAFYNAEAEARDVTDRIKARYTCMENLVKANPPLGNLKVLWGSWNKYSGYDVGVCPNYYCELLKSAGVQMIIPVTKYPNETYMLSLIQQADVWIYTDGNWNADTQYNIKYYTNVTQAKIQNMPVILNKKVFDILGSNINNWFEDAVAEPGVVLMDLVQAIHGTTYISDARPKQFLRNVFTEPAASQAPRLGSDCIDETAPLYTGWLSGPCSTASLAFAPVTRADLCPVGATISPSTPRPSDASVVQLNSMVLVAMLLTFIQLLV